MRRQPPKAATISVKRCYVGGRGWEGVETCEVGGRWQRRTIIRRTVGHKVTQAGSVGITDTFLDLLSCFTNYLLKPSRSYEREAGTTFTFDLETRPDTQHKMRLVCVLFTFENNTGRTYGHTDRRTDTPSYRDATGFLKNISCCYLMEYFPWILEILTMQLQFNAVPKRNRLTKWD